MKSELMRLVRLLGSLDPRIWEWLFPHVPKEPALSPEVAAKIAAARLGQEIAQAAIAVEATGGSPGQMVARAIEETCGTPPRWPRPFPGPWPPGEKRKVDMAAVQTVGALALGGIASRMAEGEARKALVEGAEQLLQAGGARG